MLSLNFSRHGVRFTLLALITLSALLLSSVAAFAQTTVSQGSIQGSVTDPSGAVVGGAKITISNKATGQVNTTSSSTSGTYNSGGLIPGDYVVRVEASGFKTTELPVVVQVAVTSSGNIHLEVGQGSTVVEVQGASVTVNTEQATVQGVLTADQIDKLPVDGRNFLDLAQLEPGVQIQDGQTFDPTKAGYSSVSINGVFGRTPRIELDGLDISDENVGTTTQNVALSSIQEFNISRSGLDLSTELTSAGSVNVATRSGTNDIHGMAFYNFRDRNALTANFAEDVSGYYQRNNFGGRFGGALIKDNAKSRTASYPYLSHPSARDLAVDLRRHSGTPRSPESWIGMPPKKFTSSIASPTIGTFRKVTSATTIPFTQTRTMLPLTRWAWIGIGEAGRTASALATSSSTIKLLAQPPRSIPCRAAR
jgi:hypothetical protein